MSDYYGSQETYARDVSRNEPSKRDLSVWTTEDGRTLKLTEMVDSHLLNTIRFIAWKRVALALKDCSSKTLAKYQKRLDRSFGQRYDALRAEASRRGLVIE